MSSRVVTGCALCAVFAATAHAHPEAAEPARFEKTECVTKIDPSAQETLHIPYVVETDDTAFDASLLQLPDTKSHQFFVFRAAVFPKDLGFVFYPFQGEPSVATTLPEWITQDDVDRSAQAAGDADAGADADAGTDINAPSFSATDVTPSGLLEGNAELEGLWQRVTEDDARVPITFEQSQRGADWSLRGVRPGLYQVANYIFSPPFNGWSIRPGIIKVVEAGRDMPAAVIESVHQFVFSYQGRVVRGCVDTPPGSRLNAYVRAEGGKETEWVRWIADQEVSAGPLELCFHSPLRDITGSLRLRFDLEAPDGSSASFYSPDTITALAGEGECTADVAICCDFPVEPAPSSDGGASDGGDGDGGDSIEPASREASSAGCAGCAAAPGRVAIDWVVWALALSLVGWRRRKGARSGEVRVDRSLAPVPKRPSLISVRLSASMSPSTAVDWGSRLRMRYCSVASIEHGRKAGRDVCDHDVGRVERIDHAIVIVNR